MFTPSLFLKVHVNTIPPTTPWFSKWSLVLLNSPPKYCVQLSCPSFMPHALPTSFFLIWSTGYYLITQIIFGEQYRSKSSSLCSTWTLSAYIPPSMWKTKFHTHTKQKVKLQFCIALCKSITNKYKFVPLNTHHKNNMMRNKRQDLVSDPAAHEQVVTADW